jgi:hypothetical protein
MSLEDTDLSRARIQTYVPAYQKQTWEGHADELDMSLSEFVRSMVQAGRRSFDGDGPLTEANEPSGTPSSTVDPQGSELEDGVLAALTDEEYVDWDELLATVTDDVEERLEETLQDLQEEGTVRYSGRHGGYTLE